MLHIGFTPRRKERPARQRGGWMDLGVSLEALGGGGLFPEGNQTANLSALRRLDTNSFAKSEIQKRYHGMD